MMMNGEAGGNIVNIVAATITIIKNTTGITSIRRAGRKDGMTVMAITMSANLAAKPASECPDQP